MTETPIFYDPAGRRWRHVRRTWLSLAVAASLLGGIFVLSVIVNPLLPKLNLKSSKVLPLASDIKPTPPPLVVTRRQQEVRRAEHELRRALQSAPAVPARRPSEMKVAPPPSVSPSAGAVAGGSAVKPLAVGFYVNWDDSSYASLKRNLSQLDWVVPEWVRLQDGPDPLARDVDQRALDLIRRERPETPILPLVQNYRNEEWDGELLARAVADEAARQRLVASLVELVEQNRFAGVCIDLEEVPAASQANVLRFVEELHASFLPRGWTVAQAVPFDNPDWDYRAYARATDYLMLMAYDQHWETGAPGPVAAGDWFVQTLERRMKELDPAKTIVCVGNYGYDWSNRQREATEVTFQEAVLSARDSEANIKFDPATRNPYFDYDEDDGSHHTVWFLDAVTAYNQMRAAQSFHPAGFALWRLGSEDPSLWNVFGSSKADDVSPEALRQIQYGYDIDFEGAGEILQVAAEPRDGARDVKVDASSGQVTGEVFDTIPSGYVIRRAGDRPGLVALTFDDGPDAEWTPRVLDILKRERVLATFFIIGENGMENPELVRRVVAEGHDIGNHTFTHPNLGEIPGRLTDLELNATERLIESLTGRSTTLFRPPYFGDAEPTTPDEVDPVVRAQHLGYITVGLHVDPDDWALPGVEEIVKKSVEGVTDQSADEDRRGQVVLLHDGGGDRSQTVQALPEIIHQLRARGYRFVTVSELAGLSQSQTMPVVPVQSGLVARADAVSFYASSLAGWLIRLLFIVGLVLGVGRLLIIGGLALAQWRRSRRRELTNAGEGFRPFISVIVPAYNEEKVIAKTIESLLGSDYEPFEVIVVDDGSPDRTCEVVRARFGDDRRVKLYTKENGGKAEALNYGMRRARGEIIVALDADTVFPPRTLGAMARRFHDPKVGAVAGNAKVGNRINLVTRWQALEYVTSQNLDRRAFALLNCITVVPGAVGAWRRELLEGVGGFSSDTLAEDQDLTLRVRRLGYKVGYEEEAVAWTEAPDTFRGLTKQRFRWSFGTLQCMWKHRDALLRPRYGALGFVALPNVWVFQILFPLVSPVMDLAFIWTMMQALLERLEHPAEQALSNPKQVLFYYALFLAVDWLAAGFAFLLEKREQRSLLWWLPLQRFGYRQVMYVVMLKSLAAAARGALVGWGKLERKATVEAQGRP
jgi:cellulose synthase/poly-beta-1,6-N-acetylglucosamine synthase-like glycosyltransferase/peptidoglycan/xylan/chitin deacetylase (PgdA/CDA1 family)/spore germination protein YaaH